MAYPAGQKQPAVHGLLQDCLLLLFTYLKKANLHRFSLLSVKPRAILSGAQKVKP